VNPDLIFATVDEAIRGTLTFSNTGSGPLTYSVIPSASFSGGTLVVNSPSGVLAPGPTAKLSLTGTCGNSEGIFRSTFLVYTMPRTPRIPWAFLRLFTVTLLTLGQ